MHIHIGEKLTWSLAGTTVVLSLLWHVPAEVLHFAREQLPPFPHQPVQVAQQTDRAYTYEPVGTPKPSIKPKSPAREYRSGYGFSPDDVQVGAFEPSDPYKPKVIAPIGPKKKRSLGYVDTYGDKPGYGFSPDKS
jgi:hypothetical protein